MNSTIKSPRGRGGLIPIPENHSERNCSVFNDGMQTLFLGDDGHERCAAGVVGISRLYTLRKISLFHGGLPENSQTVFPLFSSFHGFTFAYIAGVLQPSFPENERNRKFEGFLFQKINVFFRK